MPLTLTQKLIRRLIELLEYYCLINLQEYYLANEEYERADYHGAEIKF